MEMDHEPPQAPARVPDARWAATAERIDARRPGPEPKSDKTLVVIHEPAGPAAESIRGLYYALRRALGGAPLGVLGIVSSDRREGRSTIAANLALVAARETGRETALVDCDLRAPKLHELFGMDGEVGVSDVLANRADFEAVLCEHPSAGVVLVPGGRPEPEPARRFASPRFVRMLAQLRNRFDEVVLDLPPLAFSDARLVAPQCSGVLMVLRAGHTDALLARETVASLSGVKVLGVTLNDVDDADAPTLQVARRALPGR